MRLSLFSIGALIALVVAVPKPASARGHTEYQAVIAFLPNATGAPALVKMVEFRRAAGIRVAHGIDWRAVDAAIAKASWQTSNCAAILTGDQCETLWVMHLHALRATRAGDGYRIDFAILSSPPWRDHPARNWLKEELRSS